MKNTPVKKLQFIAFLAMASFAGIQESQGYKIHCPAANKLHIDKKGRDILTIWGDTTSKNGAPIKVSMRTAAFQQFDPKGFTFVKAETGNHFLFCSYLYNGVHIFPFNGRIPAGVNCVNVDVEGADYVSCH